MRFSSEERLLARQFHELKLPWEPTVGHYVDDVMGLVAQGSPFQDGIYFILNYDHFMRLIGGVDRFKECMVWMPTWEDCRDILRCMDVAVEEWASAVSDRSVLRRGEERLVLYRLILARLTSL